MQLKSGRSSGCRKEERHALSMKTGRWSESSEEHEVSYTGNESLLVITMYRTSGVTEALYGFVFRESGPKSSRPRYHVGYRFIPPKNFYCI